MALQQPTKSPLQRVTKIAPNKPYLTTLTTLDPFENYTTVPLANTEGPFPLSQSDDSGYEFPSLVATSQTSYIVGYNSPSEQEPRTVWFSKSLLNNKWQKNKRIAFDCRFPVLLPVQDNLLLFGNVTEPNTDAASLWPDEARFTEPTLLKKPWHWPDNSPIAMITSSDGGVTWTSARVIVNDPLAVQCRVCRANDGRIWLVYVQSHFNIADGKTSLWLTSSGDNGQNWEPPLQITNGSFLDRDPDLIARDNDLYITFDRGGRGISTNIQVAKVDISRWQIAAPSSQSLKRPKV